MSINKPARKKQQKISRRDFIRATTAATAFTIVPRSVLGGWGNIAPSDKLNIACIGVGGRGGANLNGVRNENIVAMCDVDTEQAAKSFQNYPKAKRFKDFRKMLDEIDNQIDAVVVSTPDHTHAVACMDAIRRGKHLYCEKPLAHSIYEIRQLMKAAREHKVITQLGNQGHSFDHIRLFCEWIWDGAIGNVHTIYAACGSNYSQIKQIDKRNEQHEIKDGLDWDLWLGPARYRPYNPMYLPGIWRGWMPFGSGVIGDWICHVVDPVFWALNLGAPDTIQVEAKDYDPKKYADTFPAGSVVTFNFPANDKRGPVKLVWQDGIEKIPRPEELEEGRKVPDTGAIVIGDKGKIMYGSHGADHVRIIPESKMRAYKRPEQKIPRVGGHHQDWLEAVKNNRQAGSSFDYGGPLTELARLGIIAIQMPGRELKWDSENMRFTNCDEANQYVNPPSREGWTL
ncbi:MAG: Gfo/Idh/MocA family oxidoreductase [Sedimentisphaerales bacterium]|nr:Gfo/Idh/MocA family oxidoreductase [Sedimentisphaerales bacterium]